MSETRPRAAAHTLAPLRAILRQIRATTQATNSRRDRWDEAVLRASQAAELPNESGDDIDRVVADATASPAWERTVRLLQDALARTQHLPALPTPRAAGEDAVPAPPLQHLQVLARVMATHLPRKVSGGVFACTATLTDSPACTAPPGAYWTCAEHLVDEIDKILEQLDGSAPPPPAPPLTR